MLSASSGYSADNSDSIIKSVDEEGKPVYRLDNAVHTGDWEAVVNIAADLSEISSHYSRTGDISYDPSGERGSTLSALDVQRLSHSYIC